MSVFGPSKPPRPTEPQAACWLAEGGVSCPGHWGLERLLGVPGPCANQSQMEELGLGPPVHSLC